MNQKEQDPQNRIFLTYLLASEDSEKMKLKEVLITLKAQAIGNWRTHTENKAYAKIASFRWNNRFIIIKTLPIISLLLSAHQRALSDLLEHLYYS